ncbi:hypothetical protein HN51_062625 [Arachis hypogaea]
MNDFLEAQYETVALELLPWPMLEKRVESIERQASVAERQVAIAEKGLAIMKQSRPRLHSESDVCDMLTELGLES